MSDEVVTDIFEFACQQARWQELLEVDAELPSDLLAEVDPEAFQAAAEHVRDSIVALVRCCWGTFQSAAPPNDVRYRAVRQKQFRPTSVAKSWYLEAALGTRDEHLLGVSVERDFDRENGRLRLYGYIRGAADEFDQLLEVTPLRHPDVVRKDDYLYFGNLELRMGSTYEQLAGRLFEAGWPVVRAYVDIIEARRGRPAGGRSIP